MWSNWDVGAAPKAAGKTYGGGSDARRRKKKEQKKKRRREAEDRAADRRKRARETPRATAAARPTTVRRPRAPTPPAAAPKVRVVVAPRAAVPRITPVPVAAADDDSERREAERAVTWAGLDIVDAGDEVRAPERAPAHEVRRSAVEEVEVRSPTRRGRGRPSSAVANLLAAAKKKSSERQPSLRAADRSFDQGAHSPSRARGVPARRRQLPLSSDRGGQWQRD